MKEIRLDTKGNRLLKGEHERSDGRYEYRYTDIEGKKHSVYAYRLQQLRKEEVKISIREQNRILYGLKELSLNDVCDMWFASKVNLKANTLSGYRRTYDIYVRNGLGKKQIEDITTTDVKSYYSSLKTSRSLSTETIGRIQNIVYQIFQYALESEILWKNPTNHAMKEMKRNHSKHTSLRNALTEEHAGILTDYIKDTEDLFRWYPVIFIMIHTGLRLGELTALRWCDVNFEKGYVDVNHSVAYYSENGEKGTFHISDGKNESAIRKIPIGKDVKKAFRLEKKIQEKTGIVCRSNIDGYTDFVFLNRFGNIYSQRALNLAISRIVERYNLIPKRDKNGEAVIMPHLTCHSFRHTFAVILCERNVNVKVAQMLLGHNDISTTMDIYMRISEQFLFKEYADKVIDGEMS